MGRLFRLAVLALCLLWGTSLWSQDENSDRDFLTGLIEDAISTDDLTVRLEGFDGALSSQATASSLTLADADGIWLSLHDLTFQWNRRALFSGRIEIERLSAARIDMRRLPLPAESDLRASSEATPFALPQLPVAVNIAEISAAEISLATPVLGEPVTARFEGSLQLADGAGQTDLALERIDNKHGHFTLNSNFDNTSRYLIFQLSAQEGPNGIAARMLDLRGRPSLALDISGEGPLSDFTSDIALRTDEQERISGQIRLTTSQLNTEQGFEVNLGGDLRPLIPDVYAPFFGQNSELHLIGQQLFEGDIQLSTLRISADQFHLNGEARFDPAGWPEFLNLAGTVSAANGEPVTLPISGGETRLTQLSLTLDYDAQVSDRWRGQARILGLNTPAFSLDQLALNGGGTLIAGAGVRLGQFTLNMNYLAEGIALADPALGEAVGTWAEGSLRMARQEGQPLAIEGLTLQTAGMAADMTAAISGPDTRFQTTALATIETENFNRFSALAGVNLTGSGAATAALDILPSDGIFTLNLLAQTNDLGFGIHQLDPLLRGPAELFLQTSRTENGTRIPVFSLQGDLVNISGEAQINARSADARLNVVLDNLVEIIPNMPGPARMTVELNENETGKIHLDAQLDTNGASVRLDGQADRELVGYRLNGALSATAADLAAFSSLVGQNLRGSVTLEADGNFSTANGSFNGHVQAQTQDLRVGIPALDPVLAGAGRISADASRSEGGQIRLESLDLSLPNLSVRGGVTREGSDTTARLAAQLRDVAILVPELSGPITAEFTALQDTQGWRVTGAGTGPAGTSARTEGRISNSGDLNLQISGDARLALANPYIAPQQIQGLAEFDLSIIGPAALSSVSGPLRITQARLAAPNLAQAIEDISGQILLGQGTARLDLSGNSAAGGGLNLSGPISLAAPFQADLEAQLLRVVLRDPALYSTSITGSVNLTGPLAGGASITGILNLGETNVQVPSSGLSALGSLPDVTHLGARSEVINTLARAEIDQRQPTSTTQRANPSGPDYPLDVQIRAPSQIFVRGRGLDAELGGALRLAGSTSAIVPIGRFDLERGRLNILGQRFDLDEGYAQIQGDFAPFMRLVATTTARGRGTLISVIIEGTFETLDIRFESTPDLPQDEVLAQLLFGRSLRSISPFQAVQMANAISVLSGSGGVGVINRLRENLSLDDFDITTDEDGNAAVRAGKYVSDNIYTDITVGSGGTSEINLNIDIDRNFTARGTVTADGETSVGLFFERDY